MKHKVVRKFFAFADFMEEEEFLKQQHSKGWRVKKFEGLTKYTFEVCEPADYSYQLDFKEDGKEDASYIQLYSDCGWEYVMKYRNWYYFRKKKESESLDYSIFSDTESKIEMCKQVNFQNLVNLLPISIMLFICVININGMETSLWKTIGLYATNIPFIFAVSALILMFRNTIKLKRMMTLIKTPYKK